MRNRKHKIQPFGVKILTGGIGSILSRLYRTILNDIGMEAGRYDALMQRYILKALQSANRNERAEARMGLSKELLKESMTWKTYIKGIEFLNVEKMELDLLLNYDENKVSRHILMVPCEEFSDPSAILSRLYQQVLSSRDISPAQSMILMDAYIEKTRSGQSKKDKTAARASLNKELQKAGMSWKTFVKGLVFLQAVKFTLFTTLYHRNTKITNHFVKVSLDEFEEERNDDAE